MKNISCKKLKEKMSQEDSIFLVDVREPFEYNSQNIGGINVPVSEIQEKYTKIPKDKDVVLYCRSGARSSMVIGFLENNFGYTNLTNLDGGIISCA